MSYDDINLLADEMMDFTIGDSLPDLEIIEEHEYDPELMNYENKKKRKYEDDEGSNKKQIVNDEIGIFSKHNFYEIICIGTLHAKYSGTLLNIFVVMDDLNEYKTVPQLTPWLHLDTVDYISSSIQITMILDLIDYMKEDIEDHEFTYETFQDLVDTHKTSEVTWNGKISTFTYIYCVKKGWLTEDRCLSSNTDFKFK